MVIIKVMGGLGNQLQQYAVYRKFLSLGKEAKLDFSWFEENVQKKMLAPRKLELSRLIDLPFESCSKQEYEEMVYRSTLTKILEKTSIREKKVFEESKMYHEDLFDLDNKYIAGYFACEKYYDDILPQLRKLIIFPNHSEIDLHERNIETITEMRQCKSVSIHIRRGDYLSKENFDILGGISTEAYYNKAEEYFKKKYGDVHFYVFSDDVQYAKERYGNGNEYSIIDWNTGKNSMLDIQLMNNCLGNICANSTFSFWGARLNSRKDHEVIRTLSMRNNQVCDPIIMHEYWKNWILIDKDGNIR